AAAAAILVKPTFEWGSEIGYQHWWTDNLRSNINAGFNQHQIQSNIVGAAQAAAMNKEIITAHANLIWNPVSSIDVGLEYTWGQRTVVNNNHGTQNVLISKLAFRF
ncbi:MAG TPA: DcaP family trimeric outer membrane transporter, partial [Stellaceae bacterium]|nr:DcaP family trimeric outer membrane transporter [Stellaceae bacterium]